MLFTRQGYERTTVDEIGAAAGLTGPSIYRHFRGKSQLLDAVIGFVVADTLTTTAELLELTEDPMRALRGLVAAWVNVSMDTTLLTQTYVYEYPALDEETRHRLRRRYRGMTDAWTTVLIRVRPELSPIESQAIVDSAFWLVSSQAFFRTTLPRDELARVLRCMVLGALLADDDPDSTARREVGAAERY
jgi:AcrR family transcriptional regulator